MGKRKVTILDPAVDEVARIALFVEGEGAPQAAKKFVDDAFAFFESLSDERMIHRPCKTPAVWKALNLRCVNFRKKYVVSYLDNKSEIVVCEFVLQKLIK
ncbi:MAG: type II toxin-antitoxin system RelE/ParE family toxin [Bacteroidetes bacterium]|nr:type II toxin-antitoxin system RelE/ParE family toxin [Bacteroidota bacterium]